MKCFPTSLECYASSLCFYNQQYALTGEEKKPDVVTKSVEVKEVENPVTAAVEKVVTEKAEDSPAAAEESTEVTPVATEASSELTPAAEESTEATSAAVENSSEAAPAATEESDENPEAATEASSENSEEENAGNQDAAEETPEIQLETAPVDFRFPTTNQTRHCFTRYVEYHRCIAAKGEGAPECDKFAKYYRALCPGEWVPGGF
ncbi:Cytochrome c oxidase subunit 6b-1 [Morella rubra]|uniref:Cytochrome c oxidase subunit 6b-1 n=1 Tax=Morella rubra TaxID=262757 RepID=A0A6A1W878_9ROSI|nr:Cytochrome c oxidase subunit 6b-1 [Morella rubra]KAB1220284.1 Cytochrome c oxidase subunit 6b-1 [Morella rubra]